MTEIEQKSQALSTTESKPACLCRLTPLFSTHLGKQRRALLMRIGFVEVERRDEGEVDYRQGARPDLRVPFIDLGEEATFLRSIITARKPG